MDSDASKPVEIHPAPTGMNLRPEVPHARVLSKRAGKLAVGALGGFLALLIYGMMTRQNDATDFARRGEGSDKRITGAKEAGRQFSNPNGSKLPDADSSEKLEPPPLTFLPRTVGTNPRSDDDARRVSQPLPSSQNTVAAAGVRREVPSAPRSWESPSSPNWAVPSASTTSGSITGQDRQREAMDSGTGINGASSPDSVPGPRMPTAQGDVNELAGLVNALGGKGPAAQPPPMPPPMGVINGSSLVPRDGEDEGTGQGTKDEFLRKLRKSGGSENYVQSTRVPALSPFEIKAGWDIPAVLEQDINSDLPGEIRALVRENVYDTASGRYLLVPQGARIVGTYDSRVAYAQNALLVAWNRIIYPDGSSIDLEGMASQDVRGQSGLRGKVNHHYGRLFGTAILSTAFSAAAVIGQTRRQSLLTGPSAQDAAGSAAASEIARLGSAITRKNLNVQPTIRILGGTRFAVRVHRDLMFEGPYQPFGH